MVVEKIKKLITRALENLSIEVKEIPLEHPADISYGDFSTNVAMVLSKQLNKNPKELAGDISRILKDQRLKEIEKIEIAGQGFINFYLSKEFFVKSTSEILKEKENWGRNNNLTSQKIIVEHTQPNPFKEFHIGHLVNNVCGEAISRLIEAQSATVKKVTYHGDVGLQVAKAVWALKNQQPATDNPQLTVAMLGKAYAEGDRAYEENEEAKKEITEINKKIYERTDSEINKLYEKGKELSLKHFEEIYTRLGSSFDKNFFESQAGEIGQRLVGEFLQKGVFEKSRGATIFPKEKSGLHTRVFINSEGLPTYEAKDLGLIKLKKDFFDFDRSITITDIEQAEYYKVVIKAAEFVFPKLKGKIEHLSHGRLRLPEGRMSSRTGNIISGGELLDELKKMAFEKMKDREIKDKDKVAEQVAVSAVKYPILKQTFGKNIVFDPEKSLSFEGDSGPYLQYTAVRSRSILEKARQVNLEAQPPSNLEVEPPSVIEHLLYRFPEIVERSAKEYSPHYLVTFLTELAGEFNGFYAKEKIVDKEDENSPYKIALTEATFLTLRNGLRLLGIETPERM